MFNLTVENFSGERLELTNEVDCEVVGIDGLTPPSANIVTSQIALMDGTKFNSATVNQRNIVIHLQLVHNVEEMRIKLYRYFRIKQYCKIYYSNRHREVYCEGYVETFENDRFVLNNQVDISIICPSPWFKEMNEIITEMASVLSLFEFPFAIEAAGIEFSKLDKEHRTAVLNSGDVDGGMRIELFATSEVINPRIINTDTHEIIGINFEMQEGDMVEISTVRGDKHVWLTRGGQTTNIINTVMKDPDWMQIPPGICEFTYDCVSGQEFLSVRFVTQNLYEGV